jgi:hypothetical protein
MSIKLAIGLVELFSGTSAGSVFVRKEQLKATSKIDIQ